MSRPGLNSGARRTRRALLVLLGGWTMLLAVSARGAVPAGSVLGQRHPETMNSLRWRGVVRQTYDYSCGTGAIANLVALIGRPAPGEQALIDRYAKLRGPAVVQEAMKNGFSLLDLKLMMKSLGYATAGVRYEAGTMPEDPRAMIVYLVVKGYRHFAVFAGMEQGQVVLLDSSRGRIRITPERFSAEWDGTALCFAGPEEHGALPDDQVGQTRAQEAARSAVFPRR